MGRAGAPAAGQAFFAYRIDYAGVFLLSGIPTDDPAAWKTEWLPIARPMTLGPSGALAAAAEGQGRPGVAYFA